MKHLRTNLKIALIFGVLQLFAELYNAIFLKDDLKFPLGLMSLHPLEELIEGGLLVFAAICLYSMIHVRWKGEEPWLLPKLVCGLVAYVLLVVELGEYLHAYCGVADVKIWHILTECMRF